MPNYEELYYIARNKYTQAIEDRNTIIKNTSELQGRKKTITDELGEKQNALKAVQQKKKLVQDALDKGKDILNNEFTAMKEDLMCTSEEYKKNITSDKGVADLSAIYSSDITDTKRDLELIIFELDKNLGELEEQETDAKNAVKQCNEELASVSTQLSNVGSESSAQRQINNYYAEMKEYEIRWQNGE